MNIESAYNKSFGEYEYKMIKLSDSLKLMAFHLQETANKTYTVADNVIETCKNVREAIGASKE